MSRGMMGQYMSIAFVAVTFLGADADAQSAKPNTIVPGPRPDDSETFDAGFGGCETYQPRPSGVPTNFPYCDRDIDSSTGKTAFEECPNACLNTTKLGLQLKIANMQFDCLFGSIDVSQYGMTCNDIGMVPRIATEIPTCTAEEGFYQPLPEICDIANSDLGSKIIWYSPVIKDKCMAGEGLWGQRAQSFSSEAEKFIFCSRRALDMLVEQYCNCNMLRNTIFCGHATRKAANPCTPWVVDLFSKEGVLIQDTESGRYKNRAGNGCDAPDYIRDLASQKAFCDQCSPVIEMGKKKTSYANIQDLDNWDLEDMGYYCGSEGYDDCDWFLEEHPYGGQYTAATDSSHAWFEKTTPDHCPDGKKFRARSGPSRDAKFPSARIRSKLG